MVMFNRMLWAFYKKNKRELPWRNTVNPYNIIVSEIMLQQTQVSRVLIKYPRFIQTFPDFNTLSKATLREILQAWQGMGYNRRAKYLKEIAHAIISQYKGIVPKDPRLLMKLPGIGEATAGSIIAFAYNLPLVFMETNIRRVFIHYFFQNRKDVHDKDIVPFITKLVDRENPREWYYALMDYSAWLVTTMPNPNRKSAHYIKQSQFENSNRQIRGELLRRLLKGESDIDTLFKDYKDRNRINVILMDLIREKFVTKKNGKYLIKQ